MGLVAAAQEVGFFSPQQYFLSHKLILVFSQERRKSGGFTWS